MPRRRDPQPSTPRGERSPDLVRASMLLVLSSGLVAFGAAAVGLADFGLPSAWLPWLSASAPLLSAAAIALPVGGLMMAVSGHDLTSDLRHVGQALGHMLRDDQLGEAPAIRSLDEVGRLTQAFAELREHFRRVLAQARDARREAEEAEQYQAEFLRAVSHELRTPLNALLGFTEILLSEIDGPLSPSQREDLAIIRASGYHLLELFDDLLDLSAAASGRLSLRLQEVDVEKVILQVRSEVLGQVQDKPVAVRADVEANLPRVVADPKRLHQILGNLAGNALRMTAEGAVILRAWRSDETLCLEVEDTGPGLGDIRPEDLFVEWEQGEGERRRGAGAGLGLAITKHLVGLHGGRIHAHSVPGEGTTFVVHLPIAGPA